MPIQILTNIFCKKKTLHLHKSCATPYKYLMGHPEQGEQISTLYFLLTTQSLLIVIQCLVKPLHFNFINSDLNVLPYRPPHD